MRKIKITLELTMGSDKISQLPFLEFSRKETKEFCPDDEIANDIVSGLLDCYAYPEGLELTVKILNKEILS